ncbi:MAG: heavy metal translocating P-type ATPase [Caldimicrobium sp.]
MEKVVLQVEGMTCVNCAKAIEISLKKLKGVNKVEVSFEVGRCFVEYNKDFLSLEEIIKVIESLGYRVVAQKVKKDYQREILVFSFLSSVIIMLLMFWDHHQSLIFQAILSLSVQIIGGLKFYRGAYSGLKTRIGNMDLLVALGTTAALIYSLCSFFRLLPGEPFFETNAFLISFVRLGKYIEERTKRKSLHLLKELFSIQTSKVRLFLKGTEKEVSIEEVLPGDILIFKTGDLIPLDSEIVEGKLELDEALVTGESMPLLKKEGDKLISGSLIISGFAKAKVLATLEKSYISMLLKMVEEAISRKPPLQRIVDKISHYFVQVIIILSLLVFVLWYQRTGNLPLSFNFALALLVISCPCALGIAVPLVISVGLVRSYKKGLLVKDPAVFEKAQSINCLILDKTGTLTKGKPQIISFKEYKEDALSIAFGLAKTSSHPYSRAIVEFAMKKGITPKEFKECKEVPGEGIYCGDYFFGKSSKFKGLSLQKGDTLLAEFIVEDELREDAKEIIEFLQKSGIKIILATGDTQTKAEKVASLLGIKEVYAEVKPEDKLKLVEEFQGKGYKVGMVGDGINDAPALAKADLSFVMAEGTDLSKRIGEVILLSGLRGLQVFFQNTFWLRKRIFQNLFWAFLYNILGIPIAGGLLYSYGVVLKPEIAGLMMALSSISVVLNSVRR